MKEKMTQKIFKQTIRMVVFYTLIYTSVIGLVFYYVHTKHVHVSLEKNHTEFHNLINSIIKNKTKHYVDHMEYLIKFTKLTELLQEQSREALYEELLPYWKQLKKENPYVDTLHIHLANGNSFLRMHKPEFYGDFVAKNRPLLDEVHKKKEIVSDYETGILATSHRVIVPLFSKETYIGAIEIGVDPTYFIEHVKAITQVDGALFIKNNELLKETKGLYSFDSSYMSTKLESPYKALVEKFDLSNQECQSFSYDSQTYQVHYIPFKNQEAFLLLFEDTTLQHENLVDTLLIVFILMLSTFPLLLFALRVQFKNFSDKISQSYESYIDKEKKVQKRLDSILSIVNDGYFEWNIGNNTIYYSPSWKKTLGYKDEEMQNEFSEWTSRVDASDLENAMQKVTDYLEGRAEKYQATFRMKHKNGHLVHILAKGIVVEWSEDKKPVRMIGTHTDVTEFREVKEAYLKTQERLQEAQNIAHIGHWELKVGDENLTWSDETYRIFGLEPQSISMTYDLFSSFLEAEDKVKLDKSFEDSITKKSKYVFEHKIILEDGSTRYVEERGKHSFDKNGELLYSLGTAQDVTEKVQTQKKLQEQEQILIAQSRHAAMGEMISMIAHQWRQPLTVISMIGNNIVLDLMMGEIKEKELEKNANKIIEMTQQLSKIIDDFRHFFKPVENASLFDICDVIEESMQIINKSLENNLIELSVSCTSPIQTVGHSRELMQVMLNLINNSKDALIEHKKEQRKISIKVYMKDDIIVIENKDNGGGVDEDILANIFDPYFTTKHTASGTGLGLYMSKTIIENHFTGELTVENIADGCLFSIKIPVQKEVQND